ncbi:c-type cytochrome [Brevundimonas halotolerans]|uniref:Mono/diheme cytochrome c family protein n=1 Tax=Brevundimonas halotolerans TaxID=69670 RepID=A0A7W9A3J8_9CAUL|nr:cytochrome c [Brevundimonas halotolerans]MBB5660542.1 mono/diheme cytochrome c family protein [Brevundimonas halotolerans]
MRALILFPLAAAGVAALAACAAFPDAPSSSEAPEARVEASAESVMRGQVLAQTRCAACHAIGPSGASPMTAAPPFRDLHDTYPVRFLQEALAEGLTTAHPAMPQVELQPDEIRDLIAYLESLEAG